jgi:alpha-ribazole phosphatase/probable phosphoglycerate mutase
VVGHTANLWALECLLAGASLEDLLGAPFAWQPGWTYTVPPDWGRRTVAG